MMYRETGLAGALLIEPERATDERGFFARTWSRDDFEAYGLNSSLTQCSISFSERMGTLRGMHYQAAPHAEAKLVRCTMGEIYDVALDLRPGSPSFKQWFAARLSAENRLMLYLPEGFAHGFQTLHDHCEVFYQISTPYASDHARGVRWNDPAFGIRWPIPEPILSERDRQWPAFDL